MASASSTSTGRPKIGSRDDPISRPTLAQAGIAQAARPSLAPDKPLGRPCGYPPGLRQLVVGEADAVPTVVRHDVPLARQAQSCRGNHAVVAGFGAGGKSCVISETHVGALYCTTFARGTKI